MEQGPRGNIAFESRQGETAYAPSELVGKENGWTFKVGRKGLVKSLKIHRGGPGNLDVTKVQTFKRGEFRVHNPDSDTVRVIYKGEDGVNRVTNLPADQVTIVQKTDSALHYGFLNY